MLLADAASPDLMTAIVGVLGGGGFAGLVGWVLKIGLPNITGQFGQFVHNQIEAAKADREADRLERAALAAAHADQTRARDEMFARELAKRDELFARELERLADAVDRGAEANARTTTVVEALSRTVAVLAARVGVEHAGPPVPAPNTPAAPMPRVKLKPTGGTP
jgi:hypothetical protein